MANSMNLNIYYQNVRGLRSKTVNFQRNLLLSNYNIVVLTETWLTDGISDGELFDNRYVVWRRDRDYLSTGQSRGGGVLVATRSDMTVIPQPQFHSSAEDLWLTICFNRSRVRLHLCVVYLCKENKGNSFSQQLSNYLSKLTDIAVQYPHDKFLIVGDFNLSNIEWLQKGDLMYQPHNMRSADEFLLIDELNACSMSQYNGVRNEFGRILDLVLSNEAVKVTECSDPLVPMDPYHKSLSVYVELVDIEILRAGSFTKFLYSKGDYISINKEILQIDWASEFSTRSLKESVDYFYEIISSLTNKYIPSVKGKNNILYPKWYSRALVKVIKEKDKFHRKYKIYGNINDFETFKLLRDRVKRLEKSCYNMYITSVEKSISNNPKHFWSFVKSKFKFNAIPSSLSFNGDIVNSGNDICNAFSSYFYSNFTHTTQVDGHSGPIIPPDTCINTIADICRINISIDLVKKQLLALDPSKSAGPDSFFLSFIFRRHF